MRNLRIHPPVTVYIALFAVSGFAGLMYESIWTHYLKLFLGHAAYAQSLVLAIFMGGMAIGSWLVGIYSARLRNLLMGYAVVEALVGVAALSFHLVFVGATGLAYDKVLPLVSSPGAAQAVKWSLASLFILPQSILLGMTFPLMTGGVVRRFPGATGHNVAGLYFSNSLGAAAGVLTSGFVLVGLVGLPGTMLTAGLLNLLLAVFVWLVAKDGEPAGILADADVGTRAWRRDAWVRVMLVAAAVTGAASFLYEIAWIRMLTLVLGASTHSFELMLAAFILGLALGSLYIRRRIERLSNPIRFLGYAQLAMGLLAIATLPIYGQAFEWMSFLMRGVARTEQGYGLYVLASSGIALAVMLPATFVAGMTLPLLTYILFKRGHGERTIGSIYAANTVGAILGILLAVHLLMPAIGVKGVLSVGAGLDLALGVALLGFAAGATGARRREMVASGVAASLVLASVAIGVQIDPLKAVSGVYRSGMSRLPEDARILFSKDGKTATIALVEKSRGRVVITTNGKVDAMLAPLTESPSPDEPTMIMAGAVALAHHPTARTAANIGFGSGLTTHTLLSTSQLEVVDSIEIEPYIVEASRGFGERVRNAYQDPRSRIHIEDAKTFFSTRKARYDLLVSEPSNPWVSGVSSLFSSEFYARVRAHLTPGGVMVQWVQGYEIDMALISSIVQALDPYFSDYIAYTPNDGDILIVAKRDGRLSAPDPEVLAQPGLARELARAHINTPADLELRRLAGQALLRAIVIGYPAPANSDYFPFLDQNAARARFVNRAAMDDVLALRSGPLPVVEMLDGRRSPSGPITHDENFIPAVQAAEAKRAADAMLGRSGWQAVREDLARDWLIVTAMLDRCDPRADWYKWRSALRSATATTARYLDADDNASVFDALLKHRCIPRLPRLDRDWLELLYAVSQRDAARMSRLAVALMETTSGEEQSYLLRAAMLGELAQDRSKEALLLWQREGKRAFEPGAAPGLDSQTMLSFAKIGVLTGGTQPRVSAVDVQPPAAAAAVTN
jgi:spermidine synthase